MKRKNTKSQKFPQFSQHEKKQEYNQDESGGTDEEMDSNEKNDHDYQGKESENELQSDGQEESLDQEQQQLQEQLQKLPFQTLLKLKKQGAIQNQKKSKDDEEFTKLKQKQVQKLVLKKRSSSSKPIERDARIPVQNLPLEHLKQRQKARDPRFDSLSGKFNQDLFEKSYKFIDEYKQNEIDILNKEMKQEKLTPEQKAILKIQLGQMKGELKLKERNKEFDEVQRSFKKKALSNIKDGKKPFFAKQNDVMNEYYQREFEKLDTQGQLDQFMAKKRKQRGDKLIKVYDRINLKQAKFSD